MDKLIRRIHKNSVVQEIERQKLPISDFAWEEVQSHYEDGESVSILIHLPTKYFFCFDSSNTNLWAHFKPGTNFCDFGGDFGGGLLLKKEIYFITKS